MDERSELFRKFGPMLLEALVRLQVDEANRIRSNLGMPQITKEIFFDEINNHLSTIEPYDWISNPTL